MAIAENDLVHDLSFKIRASDGLTELELAGELDLSTAPQLRECLARREVSESPILRVDVTGVTFLDSSSIGLLVSVCKRIRSAAGAFSVICEPRSAPWCVFEVSGLLEYLHVRDAA